MGSNVPQTGGRIGEACGHYDSKPYLRYILRYCRNPKRNASNRIVPLSDRTVAGFWWGSLRKLVYRYRTLRASCVHEAGGSPLCSIKRPKISSQLSQLFSASTAESPCKLTNERWMLEPPALRALQEDHESA